MPNVKKFRNGSDYLTTAQVAHLLGVSRPTVGTLFAEGKLPGRRVGGGIRIAVEGFLKLYPEAKKGLDRIRDGPAEAKPEPPLFDEAAAMRDLNAFAASVDWKAMEAEAAEMLKRTCPKCGHAF